MMSDDAKLFNCQSIQFIGGEPLLDKDKLFTLIEYSKRLKIPAISLVTNGVLLTSGIIDWLVKKNVHIVLPFHSWQSSIHDSITGYEGSHIKVLEAIQEIQKQHGKFSIEMVITKRNQNDFQKTKDFLKKQEIENINSQILRTGRKDIFAEKYTNKAYRTEAQFPNISKNQFFKNKEGHPCWDGKVAVLPNGDVLPCIMAYTNKIGSIKKLTLRQIIRTSDLIDKYWDLTKDKIEVCQDCEYRYACSDCRVLESVDGSLYGKNKYCNYNPSTGIWEKFEE